MVDLRTFDRTDDVSKLDGCNTRNVEYRWDLFSRELANIPPGSEALDFGAGSLRDSFELAKRGYNVTSVDLDRDLLLSYQADYDWPTNGTTRKIVTGQDLAGFLSQIESEKFSLIICFDVLEHLEYPASILRQMRASLTPDGRLFITVPNGRTLYELWFRFILIASGIIGKKLRPGEPHLQRNSPERWKQILSEAGLGVLHHDMQIGFFVNTACALAQIPLYTFGRLVRAMGFVFPTDKILDIVCSKRAMASLNKIDGKTKRYLSGLYGWNLFIAAPS
ncbi:class I SAM-dependent methyltransferase [Bradyrhizobium sp.]|uniref:class I SAM-dependent methyltransferase n=1 Tax=Bradyrhizobium sp. TaxID=376 RepID=UPI003C72307F